MSLSKLSFVRQTDDLQQSGIYYLSVYFTFVTNKTVNSHVLIGVLYKYNVQPMVVRYINYHPYSLVHTHTGRYDVHSRTDIVCYDKYTTYYIGTRELQTTTRA